MQKQVTIVSGERSQDSSTPSKIKIIVDGVMEYVIRIDNNELSISSNDDDVKVFLYKDHDDYDPFAGMFMQPNIIEGTFYQYENGDLVPETYANYEGKYEEVTGFFARLSAPGYLDATEWDGPFASREEAYQHLVELHAS